MTTLRWEEPPRPHARQGATSKWVEILTPLVDHPKRWAMVEVAPTMQAAASRAQNIKRGMVKMPPGKWEAASRRVDGEHRVYARYLGPEDGT